MDPVLYDERDGVATITLNKPDIYNSISADLAGLFIESIERATTGPCRAVLITGSGKAFCAGADLKDLEAGYQAIELGTLNRGGTTLEHRRVWTITNVTKVIDGMRAVLVLDQNVDAGEISEQAVDYLAIDTDGSVLYLGSYTEAYEGGQFVNAADAWLAGVNAVRGTLMPGDPQPGSGSFTQADIPGQEFSTAKVLKMGQSLCVPFDCYTDVLVIQEGDEYKYFASGVGELKIEPHYSGGEQEKLELINVVRLSPQGLAEFSAEAMRLDEHARQTSTKVFGNSEPAGQPS